MSKNVKIILGIIALLFFISSNVMPSDGVYMPIHAIVLSIGIFLQIGLIVLIIRNK